MKKRSDLREGMVRIVRSYSYLIFFIISSLLAEETFSEPEIMMPIFELSSPQLDAVISLPETIVPALEVTNSVPEAEMPLAESISSEPENMVAVPIPTMPETDAVTILPDHADSSLEVISSEPASVSLLPDIIFPAAEAASSAPEIVIPQEAATSSETDAVTSLPEMMLPAESTSSIPENMTVVPNMIMPETDAVTTLPDNSGPSTDFISSEPSGVTSLPDTTIPAAEAASSAPEAVIPQEAATSSEPDAVTSLPEITNPPESTSSIPENMTVVPNMIMPETDAVTTLPDNSGPSTDFISSEPSGVTSLPDTTIPAAEAASSAPDAVISQDGTTSPAPDAVTSLPEITNPPESTSSIPETMVTVPNPKMPETDAVTSVPDHAAQSLEVISSEPASVTPLPETAVPVCEPKIDTSPGMTTTPSSVPIISCTPREETCPSKIQPHKINLRHIEGDGIGFKNGYSTTEVFLSRLGNDDLIYFDFRGHVLNQGKWALSTGGGYRYYYDPKDQVFGMNLFLDYRETKHTDFFQMTVGVESLGKNYNLRANGYFPLGKARKVTGVSFDKFHRNYAYLRTNVEQAMWGFDAEIEGQAYHYKKVDLDLSLGSYFFKGTKSKYALGAKASASAIFYDTFYLKGMASYDRLFHFHAQGEIGLTFSFSDPMSDKRIKEKKCLPKSYFREELAKRLTKLPSRQDLVVISKVHGRKLAKDASGVPYFFYHVDNMSNESLGTAERPFQTLKEAEIASIDSESIYVHYGNGTTSGMNQGILLKEDQRLLGSGVGHLLSTKYGMIEITPQTPGQMPSITSSGAGVTLTDGCEVSGLRFTNPTDDGLNGVLTRGVKISRNEFYFSGAGAGQQWGIDIQIPSFTILDGTLEITDNLISTLTGLGEGLRIRSSDGFSSINVKINNNRVFTNTRGIRFDRALETGELITTGEINNNCICSNGGEGLIFNYNDVGAAAQQITYDLTIKGNTFQGNSRAVLFRRINGSVRFLDNVVTSNRGRGLDIRMTSGIGYVDHVRLDVIGNHFYDNRDDGTFPTGAPPPPANTGCMVYKYDPPSYGTMYLRLEDNIFHSGPTDENFCLLNYTPSASDFKAEIRNNIFLNTSGNNALILNNVEVVP